MPPSRSTAYLLELWLAAGATGALIARRLDPLGIDAQLFGLLSHVAGTGPVAPSVMAAEQGIPITTMRDNVQRLVARGLVRREPNPEDGRSYLVVLTRAGADALALGNVVIERLYRELGVELPRPAGEYDERLAELRRAAAAVAAQDAAGPAVRAQPGPA